MDINDLKNAVKPDGGLRANGRIPKDAIAEIIKEQTITDWDGNVLNSEEVAGLIVKYVQSGAMPVPVRRMRWADLTKQEKCVIE